MKHRSIWLTALLLGSTPLCAMAFDYGPNAPLLAAETGAQQIPGANGGAAGNDTARADIAATSDAGDDSTEVTQPAAAAEPRHVSPSGPSPRASTALRSAPAAGGRGAAPAPAHSAGVPSTTSWQSLLPGSIQ